MFTLTPEQINQQRAIDAIALALADAKLTTGPLDDLNLDPTASVFQLAASAALSVIIAHNLGHSKPGHTANGHVRPPIRKPERAGRHLCPTCKQPFTTFHGLHVHHTKKHGPMPEGPPL